jgi:WD40 repeat protein
MEAKPRVVPDSREDGGSRPKAGLQRRTLPPWLESRLQPVRCRRASAALAMVLVLAPGWLRADDKDASLPPRALARIGTDDLRTYGFFMSLAFSPDGRLVAASGANGPSPEVAIFDVRTGRRVKRLVAPGDARGWVQSMAFSPDGARLLWGEQGGEVALWDLSADRMLFRQKLHDGEVSDVAFAPDGRSMASAGGDVIRLRRVANPEEVVRDLTTKPGAVPGPAVAAKGRGDRMGGRRGIGCLAFTPDGTRLVAGTSHDATLFVWRIEDGRLLRTIAGAHGQSGNGEGRNPSLNCVAVTPDGRRIMSVGQSTKLLQETKLKYGSTNVTMSEVRFWDIETGERLADYHGDEDYGFGYGDLSPDGRRVAVGDFGRLRILDAATGRAERTIELPGSWGSRLAFSPDGTLVAMPIDNSIGLFEISTGRRLHHEPSTPVSYVDSAAWSPSGDRIVTGHHDGYVRAWDVATGKLIWHKLLAPVISRSGWNASPAFVAYSHDGKLVVVAGRRDDPVNYDNGIVAIYDAESGRTVREVTPKEVRWAALAPDGRMVVVATSQGSFGDTHFIGIELATGRTRWANPPADEKAGFDPLAAMQFEAKSPWFAAALKDGAVIRYNALTGHEQRRFLADWRTPEQKKAQRPGGLAMWHASFSADGRTLVSTQMEWIYVWDVESGAMRRKIRHPHQNGCNLTLAPDGRTLATSDLLYSEDPGEDTIRLFDIESGAEVLTLQPRDDRAYVLAFSPDGTRLFAGFRRGTGIVWDVRRGGDAAGKTN